MQEMRELEELTFVLFTITKAQKLKKVTNEVGDKRERSLGGLESISLRTLVQLDLKIVQANLMHFQQAFVTDQY